MLRSPVVATQAIWPAPTESSSILSADRAEPTDFFAAAWQSLSVPVTASTTKSLAPENSE
jgi:hypothetical protein